MASHGLSADVAGAAFSGWLNQPKRNDGQRRRRTNGRLHWLHQVATKIKQPKHQHQHPKRGPSSSPPSSSFPRHFRGICGPPLPSPLLPPPPPPPSAAFHLSPHHHRAVSRCALATSEGGSFSAPPSQYSPPQLPTVSVIIPVHNEVACISILVERIGESLTRNGWPHEVICVDDGSSDGTTLLLKSLAAEKPEVRVIILRRNFGQTAAIAAGFDFAAGDLLVTIDGDLQNDPDDIPRLLNCLLHGTPELVSGQTKEPRALPAGQFGQDEEKNREQREGLVLYGPEREDGGFDMVCGWRRDRKDDSLTRNLPSSVANQIIGMATGVKLHDYGCSLKAYRGSLVRSLRIYGELHRFLPALAAMEGAAITEIEVRHHPRTSGQSKYNLSRIPRVLSDLCSVLFFAKFKDRPMHFFGAMAAFALAISAAFLATFVVAAAASARSFGWGMAISASFGHFVASLEFFVAALLLLALGLVAELCMRTYFESQAKAVYRVREVSN